MDQHPAILFANDAFYQAFNDRDAEAMAAMWAGSVPVACMHPGWEPLSGHDRVMASWKRIFSAGQSPTVQCRDAAVSQKGDMAFVTCYEEIAGNYLAATNIFVREDGCWRIAHHQAGPTAGRPQSPIAAQGAVN